MLLLAKSKYNFEIKFYDVSKEDLYQAGVIGVIKAYKNYKQNADTNFSTYAYKYIYGDRNATQLRKFKLKELRSQIGIVQQDVYLFSGSIKENIAYGKLDAIFWICQWNPKSNYESFFGLRLSHIAIVQFVFWHR